MVSLVASEAKTTILATDGNMPLTLMALEAANDIAIDTETTGLNVRYGTDYLIGICFDVSGMRGYIPFRHTNSNVARHWISKLEELLRHKPLIWHNRKFDYHSLRTIGINPLTFQGPQYDVLMIATLVDEEIWDKSLDALAKRFLKKEKTHKDLVHEHGQRFGYETVPVNVMCEYGVQDATLTRETRDYLWPRLVKQNLEKVYWETEAPFTTALYRMEQPGVGVDVPKCEAKIERGTIRMRTLKHELHFDPGSSKDLGKYLIDELGLPVVKRSPKTGKPSFDRFAMEKYETFLQAMGNESAKKILEYRGWQKAVSSLYIPLVNKRGPDGRIKTNFNQHGTVTGRLSANDPNLQQVPRGSEKPWNGDAKSCFISDREGFCIYGWDYSQVELRLAAAYGPEPLLLAEFAKEKADPFKVLTPLIFHGQYSEDLRHKTKNGFVYPSLYGAGLTTVALQLRMTEDEARPLYDRYKYETIPNITATADRVKNVMLQRGWVSYWDGRRRHIRNKDDVHTRAWNSVLQGGAAQLMKKAVLRVFDEVADNDCIPVLTVHDEITFDIRKEAIPDYEPKIINCMTDWPIFGVKLAAEGKEWK